MLQLARVSVIILLALPSSGCFGYRLVRPNEVEIPTYDPRPVAVPAECGELIQRAGTEGIGGLQERQIQMLDFCQNQQLIRAQEEEAASRKLEAHAEVANFALQATVVAIGALIAILTWAF